MALHPHVSSGIAGQDTSLLTSFFLFPQLFPPLLRAENEQIPGEFLAYSFPFCFKNFCFFFNESKNRQNCTATENFELGGLIELGGGILNLREYSGCRNVSVFSGSHTEVIAICFL